MKTVTIFNKEYKITERVNRMLDAVNGCNESLQLVLSLGLMSNEIVENV